MSELWGPTVGAHITVLYGTHIRIKHYDRTYVNRNIVGKLSFKSNLKTRPSTSFNVIYFFFVSSLPNLGIVESVSTEPAN